MKFTKKRAEEVINNQIDSKILALKYPEFVEMIMKEFSTIKEGSSARDIVAIIDIYKAKARFAIDRIRKSGENKKAVDTFLPDIIKARIAIYMLEQLYLKAQTKQVSDKTRLSYWDGTLLQKVLFKKALIRKPVSLFWFKFVWRFISDKNILMPLVNEKGIYCFYSKEFLEKISSLIENTKCLEIAAGDGTLTGFLKEKGINCTATDDYSWEHYIRYPDFVEKLEAKDALDKYRPETVICSWTPPGNAFEKHIFNTDSVKIYVAIGTKSPLVTGNHDTYQNQDSFTMEYNEQLSSLILPPSKDNAVYIFRRRNTRTSGNGS